MEKNEQYIVFIESQQGESAIWNLMRNYRSFVKIEI